MEFIWIFTAILGLLLLYLFCTSAIRNMNYWDERKVPNKKALPIFGNLLPMVLGNKSLTELISESYKYFEGKKYYGFTMFQTPYLIISDPELANQVLVKDFTNFEDRFIPVSDDDHDLVNAGLGTMTGDRWRVLRHKLTPTFTSGKMKMMFNQIKECSEEAVKKLKEKDGEELESRNFLFKFVINVIGSISFGVKVDALNEQTEKENAFYQNSKKFFQPSKTSLVKLLITMTSPKLKQFLGIKLVDAAVDNFFQKLTHDLIKLRETDNIRRNDFLQLMIEQKKNELALISSVSKANKLGAKFSIVEDSLRDADEPEDIELLDLLKNVKCDKTAVVFTDQIIVGQTFLFITGGSESVASILSFALHYLAVNMDVQKRLQKEVDSILMAHGFTYEAVRKMTYMEQVLNEVMRLRPTGSMIGRICTENYKIPGTDFTIEKGTLIQIPVIGFHYDAEYFADPEKFDPDRFQNMDAVPKGVFLPFGGGPRICLAMRLALLEMKIFLATVMASYNVKLSDKTQLPLKLTKTSIMQHVVGGLWVQFEPRKS